MRWIPWHKPRYNLIHCCYMAVYCKIVFTSCTFATTAARIDTSVSVRVAAFYAQNADIIQEHRKFSNTFKYY